MTARLRRRQLRILLAGLALAGAVLGLRLRADAVACGKAETTIRQTTYNSYGAAPADIATVRARCRNPQRVAVLAVNIAPAAPAAARELAADALRRAPGTFAGWAGETLVLRRTDPVAARAAWARAKALNPRWAAPRP